jgi:hypothetical protein
MDYTLDESGYTFEIYTCSRQTIDGATVAYSGYIAPQDTYYWAADSAQAHEDAIRAIPVYTDKAYSVGEIVLLDTFDNISVTPATYHYTKYVCSTTTVGANASSTYLDHPAPPAIGSNDYWTFIPTGPYQGATGLSGYTGPTGPAVPAFNVVGIWNNSASYSVNDAVIYLGNLYYVVSVNTPGVTPDASPSYQIINVQGNAGATGYIGSTGPAGYTGSTGATGYNGATGVEGPAGATGYNGATGYTGDTGFQGATGYRGATGIQGNTGLKGSTGIGATGFSGSTGYTGATGLDGLFAAMGYTGATGIQGSTGIGATGATGYTGDTGFQGATGYQGSTGPVGSLGGGYATGGLQFLYVTETMSSPTISENAVSLDLTSATFFRLVLNSNVTLSFTNTPPAPQVYSLVLQTVGDGTARTVVWPTTIKWSSNGAPPVTYTLDKVDTYAFLTFDGGASWYGYVSALGS